MRFPVKFALVLLAGTACDHATEPLSLGPSEPPRWAETTGSIEHGATLLPGSATMSLDQAFVVVDDRGGIAGSIEVASDADRAARWTVTASGGVGDPVLLGVLPVPFQNANQYVRSTNAAGDAVVGFAHEDRYAGPTVGWLWTGGGMMLLPQPAGATRSWPMSIDSAGVIVGQIRLASGDDHGAVWFPPYADQPVLLPRMAGCINSARGITNEGIVTGLVRCPDDAVVRWQIGSDGIVLAGPEKLEGSDGFHLPGAAGARDVVGNFNWEVASLFRLDALHRLDLGTLAGHETSRAGSATERTDDGTIRVVGSSQPTSSRSSEARAVIWSVAATGVVTGPADLGLPDPYPTKRPADRFESARAYTVNRHGWIAGYSRRADGRFHGTLWRPTAADEEDDPPAGPGPAASFDYGCNNSDDCAFTDTSSGPITSWAWASSEGHSADGQHASFRFQQEGKHVVTLTVTDAAGLNDSATAVISCSVHRKHGLRCG
jgi:hypothetical protein